MSYQGYQSFNDNGDVYIKINHVDYGNFKASSHANITAYVGPRATFKNHPAGFTRSTFSPDEVWHFQYINARKASFVFALFKHRLFKPDSLIGEIELKISGFKHNCVTTTDFTLNCPGCSIPATVTLMVHVCDNGAPPFSAPNVNTVDTNAVLVHRRNCF